MEEPAELLYEGGLFHVIAASFGGRCAYSEFLEDRKSAPIERKKIVRWVQRLGDRGQPLNERKGHKVHSDSNLFVAKPDRQLRLVYFTDSATSPARIVITHGFVKRTSDMPPNEEEKARHTRARYFDEKGRISDGQVSQR
jgi:hypothetical protein